MTYIKMIVNQNRVLGYDGSWGSCGFSYVFRRGDCSGEEAAQMPGLAKRKDTG